MLTEVRRGAAGAEERRVHIDSQKGGTNSPPAPSVRVMSRASSPRSRSTSTLCRARRSPAFIVVGFATTMPSQDDDADRSRDGAIDAFVVDPLAQHQGHGSRLLNACADTLRADGFIGASCWVNAEDETFRLFLIAAGWALDGATREIGPEDESVRLKELRLHTNLLPAGELEDS